MFVAISETLAGVASACEPASVATAVRFVISLRADVGEGDAGRFEDLGAARWVSILEVYNSGLAALTERLEVPALNRFALDVAGACSQLDATQTGLLVKRPGESAQGSRQTAPGQQTSF